MPRTNNAAEVWNNAFASMSGMKRPTFYKFVDNLKKDESIARCKIIDCLAGKSPDPPKKHIVQRDAALKRVINSYIESDKKAKEAAIPNETFSSDDEEMTDQPPKKSPESDVQMFRKSATMTLLAAVAQNTRID